MSPKLSLRGIAREVGVSHSTVVRELERSSRVIERHDDYYTQAQKSQEAAHERRVAASKRKMRLKTKDIRWYSEFHLQTHSGAPRR